jgi:hypothetical protein
VPVIDQSGDYILSDNPAADPFARLHNRASSMFDKDMHGTTARSMIGVTAVAMSGAPGQAVVQATSKSTAVSLDALSGNITLNAAALLPHAAVSFALINRMIDSEDLLTLNHLSAESAGSYHMDSESANGSAIITLRNLTAGALSEPIVIAFRVEKGRG